MDGSEEELFLAFCEQYVALLEERRVLLARVAELQGASDQDVRDEIADAIEDNEAKRRVLLWRIYENANEAHPEQRGRR
jgi:hypothetical protein